MKSQERTSHKDICLIPFSSGTSGQPKGVMIRHQNITSNIEMFNGPNPYEPLLISATKDFQDVLLCVLPFYHITGFVLELVQTLSLGCKLITLPRFDPAIYISAIVNHKVSYLATVPPMLQALTKSDLCSSYHLASVRTVICGAAPLGGNVIERFIDTK